MQHHIDSDDQRTALRRDEIVQKWRDRAKEVDGIVDEEVIAEVVARMTGIPLKRLEKDEAQRLLSLEEELHKRIISQDEAIKAVARAIRRARSGLKDPNRPMGSFIFIGPSGVGKTELCKALAEFMFGDPDSLIQIDMSEYMEKHNVSRLIGAPPGYVGYEEGGQLTERIRRRPYAVVLLDEIEKAHPDVFNMLLQIMEEGHLTDSFGRRVDFKNVVLIMTSNIGADRITNQSSFGFEKRDEVVSYEKMKEVLKGELERYFRPEFLNRVDEVVVFHKLTRQDMTGIVVLETNKIAKRLKEHGVTLELTAAAKEYLIDKGTDEKFGARPLRRAIGHLVEDPLSEGILRGEYAGRNRITVDVEQEDGKKKLVFRADSDAGMEQTTAAAEVTGEST